MNADLGNTETLALILTAIAVAYFLVAATRNHRDQERRRARHIFTEENR